MRFGIDPRRNHTAYQLGWSIADFPFNNLSLTLQYTRIRPFVYVHFIPAQTYENNGYSMGHWLGQNSDLFSLNLNYRVKRGLYFDLSFHSSNYGSKGTPIQQTAPGDYPFLWGNRTSSNELKFEGNYEIIHDVFMSFKYTKTITEQIVSSSNRSSSYLFSIRLGF